MKDEKKYRMCWRKNRYTSKRQAELGWGKHVYSCPICSGWHRSSKPYRRKNK